MRADILDDLVQRRGIREVAQKMPQETYVAQGRAVVLSRTLERKTMLVSGNEFCILRLRDSFQIGER